MAWKQIIRRYNYVTKCGGYPMEKLPFRKVFAIVIFSFCLVNQCEFEHYRMLDEFAESFHSDDQENENYPSNENHIIDFERKSWAESGVDIFSLNGSTYTEDTISIYGYIESGVEGDGVYVEASQDQDRFESSSVTKYKLMQDGLYDRAGPLYNNEYFELTLDIKPFYSLENKSLRIFIKHYEYWESESANGSGETWLNQSWINLNLPACQGLVAPPEAIAAGGHFEMLDAGGCRWIGSWMYDPDTDVWYDPYYGESGDSGESEISHSAGSSFVGIFVPLIITTTLVTVLVILRKRRNFGKNESTQRGMPPFQPPIQNSQFMPPAPIHNQLTSSQNHMPINPITPPSPNEVQQMRIIQEIDSQRKLAEQQLEQLKLEYDESSQMSSTQLADLQKQLSQMEEQITATNMAKADMQVELEKMKSQELQRQVNGQNSGNIRDSAIAGDSMVGSTKIENQTINDVDAIAKAAASSAIDAYRRGLEDRKFR